jgi:hypothetical protein
MLQFHKSILDRLGKAIQAQSEDIADEPLPRRWVDLIHHLDEKERMRLEVPQPEIEPPPRKV